jgi:serine phosphatase RsbU (regulator of sigma subunit)
LQRALLPQELPEVPGVEVGVRYIPGFVGVEIGGDWYDVIRLDEHRFFFVVGDVSGRGVAAGAVMAALHFAIRGFVSEGHQPAKILDTLTGLLDVTRDHHFATVLCGIVDIDSHEMTIANAGHLPPLLISAEGTSYLATNVGPPIGVKSKLPYEQVTLKVPAKATVLTYTDGLIERRGETLDDGMNRLQELTVDASTPLEDLLGTLVATLGRHDSDDDTAILGMRWLI